MRLIPTIARALQHYIFIIRFLILLAVFRVAFWSYYGLVTIGGITYSSFFDKYLDIVEGQGLFISNSAKRLLSLFYNNVHQFQNSVQVDHSQTVAVNFSCLGFGVLSFWFALVFANTGIAKFKLKWILIGFVSITTLNILRIAVIAAALHEKWTPITSMDHHGTFNLLSYVLIILLFLVYIRTVDRQQTNAVGAHIKRTTELELADNV
jgi:exosortase/archaeosortase family protein